jgi:hypothetical protein
MKAVLILVVVGLFILAGCKDITDSYKPGSFGASAQDNKIVDYYTAKYGDLTASGTPRILEPLISSDVKDYIPSNKVVKFSKDTTNLYAWFVYDNFKENDEIIVEWKYLDRNYVIYTFKSSAGGDFGRGVFILERPDTGWPLGKYEVTISGLGTTSKIDFEIIDGSTVTVPLPFDTGAATNVNTRVSSGTDDTTPPADLGDELYTNHNIAACGYTDTSTFTISQEVYVAKLRMWYYWSKDEVKLPYTLTKDGVEYSKGDLVRASCDPYQTSWCEANIYPKKNMPAGKYIMTVANKKMCQNSGTQGNGMYGVYGKKLGTANSNTASVTDSGPNYYQVDFSNGNHKRMIKGALVDNSFMIAGSVNNGEAPLVWLAQGNTPGGDGYPASFSWNVPDQEAKTLAFASVIAWNPLSSTWMGKKIGMITVEGSNGEKKTFDLIYGTHTQGWNEPAGNINNQPTTEVITNLPSIYENKAFVNKFDLDSMKVRKITAEVTNIGTYDGTRSSVLIIYGMTLLQ